MARSPSPAPFDRDRLPPGVDPVAGTDPRTLGPYTVVGRIGAGGMGAVYAGIAEDGTRSAIKVVHEHFAADPEFLARFGREVDLMSRVRASCTPAFHGADLRAQTPWLAIEYVPGPTLRKHVREKGALSGGMLMAVAAGLAEALDAIHSAGVVHRDLKPGNVIMSPDGPKVLDFGIARAMEGTALTATGGVLGTPGWMAPEQYGGAEATPSSDMFAWAALVYFAATGQEPFGRGPVDVVSHRTRNEVPDLAAVPEEVRGLVRAGLGQDPGRRPTAAQALAELTGRWSRTRVGADAREPVRDVTVVIATEWSGVEVPQPRRVRRGRRRLLLIPAVAAGLVLALVGSWLLIDTWTGGADGTDGAQGDQGGTQEEQEEGQADEADGGPGVPTVTQDPEAVAAVIDEAEEIVLGADSFESEYALMFDEAGDPPTEFFRYTEDPEPIYYQASVGGPARSEIIEVGEGPDDVVRNTVMQNPGAEDSFYRDPADAAYDTRRELWESRVGEFFSLLRDADEGTYAGVEEVEDPQYLHLYGGAWQEGPREGHLYRFELPPEDGGEDPDSTRTARFWVDEDGVPQLVHHNEEWTDPGGYSAFTEGHLFFADVGGPVEVDLPEESEIGDGPP